MGWGPLFGFDNAARAGISPINSKPPVLDSLLKRTLKYERQRCPSRARTRMTKNGKWPCRLRCRITMRADAQMFGGFAGSLIWQN
jgi:hypothetical protein